MQPLAAKTDCNSITLSLKTIKRLSRALRQHLYLLAANFSVIKLRQCAGVDEVPGT
jgi:hypothetical protein